MKKYIYLFAITIYLLFGIYGCNSLQDNLNDDPNIENTANIIDPSEYITMTVTKYEDPNLGADGDMLSTIILLEPSSKETKEVFSFPYTTQYPLGYYDKIENTVYYTKRITTGEGYGDQIFSYDLNIKKEIQLTDDLFAVNYILSEGDSVFFVAVKKKEPVLLLGNYNKITGETTYWRNDGDTSVETLVLDRINKRIFISAFSEDEKRQNIIQYTIDNFIMPKYTVYETDFDFSYTKEIHKENMWIRMLLYNDSNLIAVCDGKYNQNKPSEYKYIKLDSQKSFVFEEPPYRLQRGEAGFSLDKRGLYTISEVDDQRGIFYWNFTDKIYKQLFVYEDGFINNMQPVQSFP